MRRKKKKQKRSMKGGLWTVGFLLLALLMAFAVNDLANRNLKDVVIQIHPNSDGLLLIDKEAVLLQIERKLGHRLAHRAVRDINITVLEQAVESSPFIETAEVFIDAKNKIHLDVKQREPILRMMPKQGKGYFLDANGQKIPLTAQASPRVMVVTGNVPSYKKDFISDKDNPMRELFVVAKHIHQDELLKPLVEQIHLDGNSEMTMVPKLGDQKIIFGTVENAYDKFEKLKIFYQEGLPVEGWSKFKTINLTYNGQVVCGKA